MSKIYNYLIIIFIEVYFLLSIPIALVFVLLIRLISPFYLIRFNKLVSSRIGHFAANLELYFCEKKHGINRPNIKSFDILYFDSKICNRFLAILWKRKQLIFPHLLIFPVHRLNRWFKNWEIYEVGSNINHDRDVLNLLKKSEQNIFLNQSDKALGHKLLLKYYGINENDKIICLLVRDAAYLKGASHHNYRDADVNKFLYCADKMTDLGYFVFRMGAVVEKKIITNNKKIIDYANTNTKSPFLDIFLAYRCSFVISTGSGWDSVATHLFRKPICFVNYAPIGSISSFLDNCIILPRLYIRFGIVLSLKQIFESGNANLVDSKDFQINQIVLLDSSEKDIFYAVSELEALIKTPHVKSNYISDHLQLKFKNLFYELSKKYNLISNHGDMYAFISNNFLLNNRKLLE
jgi:putative glycosyltransferase (TIGR04372 family)